MSAEILDKGTLTPSMDGSGSGGEYLPPTANDDGNYEGPDRVRRVEYAIRSAHWQGLRVLRGLIPSPTLSDTGSYKPDRVNTINLDVV
jgi:hypothetical protein